MYAIKQQHFKRATTSILFSFFFGKAPRAMIVRFCPHLEVKNYKYGRSF